ncbi:glycosyltransferase [Candidatus Pacebacteria bacterium]|nr:glycosyltransferase [Candidatus Paceibacterota bacterium]
MIIPVYNEQPHVWDTVLRHIKEACIGLEVEIIVVPNGKNAEGNAVYAEGLGFNVYRLSEPSKRQAIALGATKVKNEIAIILDSDTIVPEDALKKALWPFIDEKVGGVTPRHFVMNRTKFMHRMSDWLEDNRFNEIVKGQSVSGAVSCLPGRLFALRADELKKAAPHLVSQTFLGMKCVSGDDRFLTSWLLSKGYKTVYQSVSQVYTEAPDTLGGLIKQRLRWSRGSFRGTIFALPWLWKHPYTCFTVLQNIFMRWFLFLIYINAFFFQIFSNVDTHWMWEEYFWLNTNLAIITGLAAGFFIGGFFKRIRHLLYYPQDFTYYPVFLLLAAFVLTPLEWYGNLTCWKQGWITRSDVSAVAKMKAILNAPIFPRSRKIGVMEAR